MQALVKMASNWNDDDRDTRVSFNLYRSYRKEEETQSVCSVLRDYFKDQKESLYTWTVVDYNKEMNKRLSQALPPPIIMDEDVMPQPSLPGTEEKQDQEEFNNEIMDNQIYKKSLYS